MRDGTCPKCGANDVYHSSGDGSDATGLHAAEGVLLLNLSKTQGAFGRDRTITPVEAYLCAKCGYVELYARDLLLLSKVAESANWSKVK